MPLPSFPEPDLHIPRWQLHFSSSAFGEIVSLSHMTPSPLDQQRRKKQGPPDLLVSQPKRGSNTVQVDSVFGRSAMGGGLHLNNLSS